jgi:hypothetical protein
MNSRTAARCAWSLFGFYLLCVAVTLGYVVFGNYPAENTDVLLSMGVAAVGALVAAREPANPVGWLLLVAAVAAALPAEAYAYSGDRPGAAMAAWVASWLFFVWLGAVGLLLPLLFPTGRLLSSRWRMALAVAVAAIVVNIIGTAFRPGTLDDAETSEPMLNPLGASGPMADVVTAVTAIGAACMVTGFVLGPTSLVLRFRRSHGRERQQLKVLVYVVVAFTVMIPLFGVAAIIQPLTPSLADVADAVSWLIFILLVIVGVPFAVGVAILRHRLYGIDVVINRTLVYGLLTVTLAVTYLASVLVLRLVLSPLTGESDLEVAASTLAVAALFRPFRSRIQVTVDRRFYRSRYDAARTLEAFSGGLRHSVDLNALEDDLRDVVNQTMQPKHLSLWLPGRS